MKKREFLRTVISFSSGSRQADGEIDQLRIPSNTEFALREFLDPFLVTLIGIYIFGFRYIPMQDYPNWLYQGFLFKEYLLNGNSFNGFFHLYPYVPPNAISTICIGLLSLIISPFIAGKIFLFMTALLLYFGARSYLSLFVKNQNSFVSCIAFYSIFNLSFLMGFVNYSFGFGLALLVMVYLVKNDLKVSRWMLSLLVLLLYLSHFLSLAMFAVFLAVYIYHTKKYRLLYYLAPAFIPAVLLFLEYYFTKGIDNIQLSQVKDSFIVRWWMFAHDVLSVIIPFHHYKWVLESGSIMKGVNHLFCVFIGAFCLYVFLKAFKKRSMTLELRLSLCVLMLILILPGYLGGVLLPSSRLIIFFALNIFASFVFKKQGKFLHRVSIAVGVSLVSVSYLYNVYCAYQFDKQVASGIVPRDAIIRPRILLEGTDGFTHLCFYHGITHHEPLRVFRTGLFAYPEDIKGDSFGDK